LPCATPNAPLNLSDVYNSKSSKSDPKTGLGR
jgi:hypothetical protein